MTSDEAGYAVCGRLDRPSQIRKWKDEMAPGEMWSLFGEKWLTARECAGELRLVVVYEAPADFTTATELADRVLMAEIDWIDEITARPQRPGSVRSREQP